MMESIKGKNKALKKFSYQFIDDHGNMDAGDIEAEDIYFAKALLRQQGIKVKSISLKKTRNRFHLRVGFSSTQRFLFFQQFSRLLRAGIDLSKTMEMLQQQFTDKELQPVLAHLQQKLWQGHRLSDGLKDFPQHFDRLSCALIMVGELSGRLDEMLHQVYLYQYQAYQLRKKIIKALRYPLIVLSVSLIIAMFMLIKIVPAFEVLFANFNADLPKLTQIVLQLSTFFDQYFWQVIAAVAGLSITWHGLKKSEKWQFKRDQLILKLPVVGRLKQDELNAQFSQVLGITLSAGVPLLDGLQAAAEVSQSQVWSQAILRIKHQLACGQSLFESMQQQAIFSELLLQLVAVGEQSGQLEEMLQQAAIYYTEQVDDQVDRLGSVIEPLLLIVLGAIIGVLVLAMYLPMFELGQIV